MARIGTVIGRNTMIQALNESLNIVVPYSGYLWAFHTCNKHSTQVVFLQELLLSV